MRIVYLHQYFKQPSGVGSTRSYEFAKRLAARGHDVHMVTTARSGAPFSGWKTETVSGFTVHSIHVPYGNAMTYRERVRAFFTYAMRAAFKARSLRGDAVFATSTPLTVAIPGVAATLFRRSTPLIFEVRDLWPEVPIAMGALSNPLFRSVAFLLQRVAYNNARHVVALSPDMKEGIVARGVPETAVSVIPNSSDVDFFMAANETDSGLRDLLPAIGSRQVVLYAGTLGRVNAVEYIVSLAQAAIREYPEYCFVVIGNGSERNRVLRAAEQAGVLEKNFFLLDPVPKTQLPAVFRSSAMTLSTVAPIPALWANSANKFFDSFAAGRPIAINHEGWQADLLRSRRAGLVLHPSDHRSAVEAINTLLSDQALYQEVCDNAAALGRDEFSRDAHAEHLAAIIEDSVRSRPHGNFRGRGRNGLLADGTTK